MLIFETYIVHFSGIKRIFHGNFGNDLLMCSANGGRNNVKVDDEMKDCLNEIVNENCLLTLEENQ